MESLVNDPKYPCGFCAVPWPLQDMVVRNDQNFCSAACATSLDFFVELDKRIYWDRKKQESPLKKTEEWVGDAALGYLVRRELRRRYPKLLARELMKRERVLVTNSTLHDFGERKKLGYYQHGIERRLADSIEHNFQEAAQFVAELMDSSEALRGIDRRELGPDGALKPEIARAIQKRIREREERTRQWHRV